MTTTIAFGKLQPERSVEQRDGFQINGETVTSQFHSGPDFFFLRKIDALQRMAYGYRDHDYFIAKLYALHLAKFALIG